MARNNPAGVSILSICCHPAHHRSSIIQVAAPDILSFWSLSAHPAGLDTAAASATSHTPTHRTGCRSQTSTSARLGGTPLSTTRNQCESIDHAPRKQPFRLVHAGYHIYHLHGAKSYSQAKRVQPSFTHLLPIKLIRQSPCKTDRKHKPRRAS